MGGDKETNRNLILAAVLSMLLVFVWQMWFMDPPPQQPAVDPATPGAEAPGAGEPTLPAEPVVPVTRAEALAAGEAARVEIAAPAVTGTISLKGARLDDLHLVEYRVDLADDSETVVLLNPAGVPQPYFVSFSWQSVAGGTVTLPNEETIWEIESGTTLSPGKPVTLRWDNGEGQIFRLNWSVDERYMFTVTQSVENAGDAEVKLAPFASVTRRGEVETADGFILHQGAVGMFDGELSEVSYDEMFELPPSELGTGRVATERIEQNGWIGFTDKYWMTVLAPAPGQSFDAFHLADERRMPKQIRVMTRLPGVTVAPGETISTQINVFAGAKELATVQHYEEALGIEGFDDSIDWGWFYFLTKPIANLLAFIKGLVGNMGVAIIVLTLLVKAVLFPLAYKSYVSMSKMKKLQPEMQKIKERVGDDKQKMQQEMIALYKKEKVNPAAGCLPILLQIPIFFSLYKVIFVTIELRHAPFFGWIQDLSAPDPTSWMNLFGLLPYEIPAFLGILSIGVFPILMGVTMWMQQKLNPAPPDKTQAAIFAWMPWIFMFMLGHFASGLVIYWCANNIITFIQQYIIMRSQGVDVDFFGNVKKSFKRKKTAN